MSRSGMPHLRGSRHVRDDDARYMSQNDREKTDPEFASQIPKDRGVRKQDATGIGAEAVTSQRPR